MTNAAKVILVGKDSSQLDRMASVLIHFWLVQKFLLDGDEPEIATSDLAIVCDSVPEPERQDLVWWMRQHDPRMLVVKMNGFDSGPHAGADATVDEMHGPGALVSTIYGLLTERDLGSRSWAEQNPGGWVQ